MIRSLVFVILFLLSSEGWSQALPFTVAKNVYCDIDPLIAQKWIRDEIKIYFNNDSILLNKVENYFDTTTKTEIDRQCFEFVNKTISLALDKIQTINPGLIAETNKRLFSNLKISFVDFCYSHGRPLFAEACFKKNYFLSPHEIQISAFSSRLAVTMFFPQLEPLLQNKRSTYALVHEFLHYFGWANLPDEQHDNPYKFEAEDAIYSCTNVALPLQIRIYGKSEDKETILKKQEDVCRQFAI